MDEPISANKILSKLKTLDSDRKKITLYLSESLYSEFRNACGDIAASRVIEELMTAFLKSISVKKKKQ
jgi:hypothetical protein